MLYSGQNSLVLRSAPSSETQGQLVGAGKSLNGREKKLGSVIGNKKQKFCGTNQKPEQPRPFGTGPLRPCPKGLFSSFLTFLRPNFFVVRLPFRLFPAPTNCPWVSEDDFRVDSLFHHLCAQYYAAQNSYVPLLSLRRDSPPKSSLTFSVRFRSSVGRVTVDLIRRSWIRFPPRSKEFFFTSCASLILFTRANAQWVIHGSN